VLAGVPDKDRTAYDDILYQLLLSHDKYLGKTNATDLSVLAFFTRTKSRFEIVEAIHEKLFSHVEDVGPDVGGMLRRKAYLLGLMLKLAWMLRLDVGLPRIVMRSRTSGSRPQAY
jgi:hypothetical protein